MAQAGVAEHELRARVRQDLGDLRAGETRVDGTEDAAARRHAEVRLEQLGPVRRERRDPIAWLDPRAAQRASERVDALGELARR